MRIVDVRLTSADPAAAAVFYRTVLDLPVTVSAEQTQVLIGASTLTLVPGPTGPGVHHLAFDVPENRFAEARRWLAGRVELVSLDGVDEFAGPGAWDSQSVYFTGPDGSILELIARHASATATATGRPFGSADLVSVSEVGIAVTDPQAAVAELGRAFDLAPFGWASDTFAPLGDQDGLLIVVSRGRVWFPTHGLVCQGGPATVTLAGRAGVPGSWSSADGDCVVSGG